MEFRAFATKLIAPACLIRHLPLAIVIVSALLSGPARAVDINQHGLTGSWYNPAAAGQGVEIEVYQDAIAPGVGYLQGSRATFSVGWETGQRWYTFGGTVQRGNLARRSHSSRTSAANSTLRLQLRARLSGPWC